MVKLNNFARRVETRGDIGWYEWRIFVDEDPSILNRIATVQYELHPTFPEPHQLRTDPHDRFAVETAGWGQFTILATITYQDGRSETIPYALDLDKPWPSDSEQGMSAAAPSR